MQLKPLHIHKEDMKKMLAKKKYFGFIFTLIVILLLSLAISCSPTESQNSGQQIVIEPPMVHFFTEPGQNPPAETLELYSPYGPLNWSLSDEAPWLMLSQTHGTADKTSEQPNTSVTISIDTYGLEEGTYRTSLKLSSKKIGYQQDIPVNLYITDVKPGQKADIDINVEPNSELDDMIHFEQLSVSHETLVNPVMTNTDTGILYYHSGDLCLLITGIVRNSSLENMSIGIHAIGYDKNNNEVSWSLATNPFPVSGIGINILNLPEDSVIQFQASMAWSDHINQIKLFVSKRIPSDIPSP
jgi:hypothetical protein